MKKRKAKINIEKIMNEVASREEIGRDMFPIFPVAEDYLNPCRIMCNGMSVKEVYQDAKLAERRM